MNLRLVTLIICIIVILSGFVVTQSPTNSIPEPGIGWSTCRYSELTLFLHQLIGKYSTISRLYSVGKSVEGRDLWVVLISDRPIQRPLLRPQVKFIGNIIGNYGPSCFILLRLISHLLKNYKTIGSLERSIIESYEIQIFPNMNPDGFLRSQPGACSGGQGRYNAAGFDLNRDFPDIFNPKKSDFQHQPETMAVINWINKNSFALSVSVMSGAKVVSYPYDSIPLNGNERIEGAHLTPDDEIFRHLARTYVQNMDPPHRHDGEGSYCPQIQKTFPDGTVNGAEWGAVQGTMLDFNYAAGTFEIMVGISCCRNENNDTVLNDIWEHNKMALLRMIIEVEFGLRGQVVDAETHEAIVGAEITKFSHNKELEIETRVRPMTWRSKALGEFWRLLLPGKYLLEVRAEGYEDLSMTFEIYPTRSTVLFVEMEKLKPSTPFLPVTNPTDEEMNNEGENYLDRSSSEALSNISTLGQRTPILKSSSSACQFIVDISLSAYIIFSIVLIINYNSCDILAN